MPNVVNELLHRLWSSKRLGWRVARILLMLCFGFSACILMFEDQFIYYPEKYPSGLWDLAEQSGRKGEITAKVEDCYFSTIDRVTLHGWYCSPQKWSDGTATPVTTDMVLLWFHGNAGNLSHRFDMIRMLMQLPVAVFIIDYRGYGRSEGSPSEEGLYLDALAAWQYLTEVRGISSDNIIVLGKSLGGVPAVDLCTRVTPAGLIVQSSFTSAADMATTIFPFIPKLLIRSKMDSINKIGHVSCRKLFIHSPADEIVPYRMGQQLYDAAQEPKSFLEVQDSPHNSTYIVGGKNYLETLRAFVRECRPR
jgi:pimeloyl-ACP methyl ester carboxylesterase